MRVSRLMLVTLRDDPADAEIVSHKLLLRAGYTRRISPGVYAYLPLLWRVLQKISQIVREEMNGSGALEVLLPQLQPADLWERSGRWAGYTAGEGIMFHLTDRQGREQGLGPTHEEVITALAADLIRSYRQLPVNLYQIQTKFRDEIRPRFGLMRGREFIMKDAYSFHADEVSLRETYAHMDGAYRRIFARCGLRTVAVEADSGAIGGSASQEFMVTAEAGEDLVLTSADGRYAANQERAVSLACEAVPLGPDPCQELATPGQITIEALAAAHGFDPTQIVKVLLLAARFADGLAQPVLVSLRGDQQLNEVKLANAITAVLADHGGLLEVAPLDEALVQRWSLPLSLDAIPFGYLGPDLADETLDQKGKAQGVAWTSAPQSPVAPPLLERHFLRLADPTALELQRFVCGANKSDSHRVGATWADLGPLPQNADLRAAQPGDRCIHDPSQQLEATRGIEVGHIFQLGRKYSQALEATFTTEAGQEEPLWMGCYGIGVSRLAQAAVEQNHDANGICWPLAIAPFTVIIVIASLNEPLQVGLAERLYGELQAAGVEVLLDDRDERAGVKFKDADLIGIPFRVVVGRGAANGQIELVSRLEGERQDLGADELLTRLMQRIAAESPVTTPTHP